MNFTATPDIYTVGDAHNIGGFINLMRGDNMDAGSSLAVNLPVAYNNVDSAASGTISKLILTSVSYQTPDDYIYSFNTYKNAVGPTFCGVNNIPHIKFQNPKGDTLSNGCSELAEVKLTGDTDWVLNALPVRLFNYDGLNLPKAKLIVRSQGKQLATTGGIVDVNSGYQAAETVVHFTGGFKHVAGKTVVLKIYASIPSNIPPLFITITMFPMSSFLWTDGLGKLIKGSLNGKYYKEQTGEADSSTGCCGFKN